MEIDIFDEIQKMRQLGRKAALATIVQIRGSVPSFQSAKMLIRDDGSTLGSVGGGCVEAEVWTAAQDVMRDEKSKIMTFDLTDESMAESGLICGGKIEIFVEPILPTAKMVIFGAGHIATQVSKIATIAGFRTTVVDNRPVYANAERFPEAETIHSDSFGKALRNGVNRRSEEHTSELQSRGQRTFPTRRSSDLVEPILPTAKMVIFGAGHIATQVSKIATIAGFRTTVVDNRPVYANAERFPEAETIHSDSFGKALRNGVNR